MRITLDSIIRFADKNKGKLSAVTLSTANFIWHPFSTGNFSASNLIMAGLGIAAGFYYDVDDCNRKNIKGLEFRIQRADRNNPYDRMMQTIGGTYHVLSEGKDKALRHMLTAGEEGISDNFEEYLKKEPHINKLLSDMRREVDETDNQVMRTYFNPVSKAAIELSMQKGVDKPYIILAREKPEAEIKGFLIKHLGPIVAEYVLSKEYTGKPSREKTAVLFADLRSYTKWCQDKDPNEIFGRTGGALNKMNRILEEEGVVMDKYIGDCIMAFSGPPLNKAGLAYRILKASFRMLEAHNNYRERLKSIGKDIPGIGIGISYGTPAVGFYGEDSEAENENPNERIQYTVIGESVNLASRLCGKSPEDCITVSEDLIEKYRQEIGEEYAGDEFLDKFVAIDPVQVKGYDTPVRVLQFRMIR